MTDCKHLLGLSTKNGNFKCVHCGFERPSWASMPEPPLTGIDAAAANFADGFNNGNVQWADIPEHQRENYREGIRAILDASPPPPTPCRHMYAEGKNVCVRCGHKCTDAERLAHGQYGKKAAVLTTAEQAYKEFEADYARRFPNDPPVPTGTYANEKRQPPKPGYHAEAGVYLSKNHGEKSYTLGATIDSADQAREAAHLLNQIAEYLDSVD
jgi:hypothetical protein